MAISFSANSGWNVRGKSYRAPSAKVSPSFSEVLVNYSGSSGSPMGSAQVDKDGDDKLTIDNPLVQTSEAADAVANWVAKVISNRILLSGEYRADPRLDPLDVITVSNKYASTNMVVTDIDFSYTGCFNGSYKGRVIQ